MPLLNAVDLCFPAAVRRDTSASHQVTHGTNSYPREERTVRLSSSMGRACACSFRCPTQQSCVFVSSNKKKTQNENKKKTECLCDIRILLTKRNVVRVQFTWMPAHIRPESTSPRGLMDKASVSEAEDCGFESRRG